MSIKRYEEGDELRRYARTEISTPMGPEETAALREMMEGLAENGPYGFEGSIAPAEAWAKQVLSREDLPTDGSYTANGKYPDPIWFAAQILNRLRLVRGFIKKGEADKAAWFAFELGLVAEEQRARVEFPARTRRHGAKKAINNRYAEHRAEKEEFKSSYREVRKLLPNASRSDLINKVFEGDPIPNGAATWAKEADREDGIVRKGGRPKAEG